MRRIKEIDTYLSPRHSSNNDLLTTILVHHQAEFATVAGDGPLLPWSSPRFALDDDVEVARAAPFEIGAG